MLDIPAAVVGEIIFKTLYTYPELFTGNKTLGNVFAIVRNDTTILSLVSNTTGLTWAEVEGTIDLYLTVETYLSKWNEAPSTASNTNVKFNGTGLCKPEISQGYFTVLTLLPALFIILLLSFLNHRKRKIEVFGRVISRPGLCIPVNLVDSYENRFAFACAFGATTGKCVIILLGGGYSEVFPHGFTTWLERPDVPAFLGIFKKILAMFTIGFAYYPLFACMATNYKITGYVIGVLYSAFWLLIKYSRYAQCPSLQSECRCFGSILTISSVFFFLFLFQILFFFAQLAIWLLQLRAQINNYELLAFLVGYIDVSQWLFIEAVSLLVAIAVAAVYSAILVANMLSWYRGHLLRLQRGEKHFLPLDIFKKDPPSITVATLKYSGFQVAYLCWGTTVILIALSTIGFIAGLELILPVVDGRFDSWLWVQIRNIWPAIALSMIFYWIQLLLSKYVFLIDRGATMALDNRRLFHVCTFFLFFFNIFLGLFSCLKRVVIGAVIGIMFLARTQKSVLSRDFELRDPGFNAYVGYLLLEHTHANPVLVTFCQLLIKTSIDEKILKSKESNGAAWNHVDENDIASMFLNQY
ncbi:PREDICTED: stimulated by retinoic acid gene 6 protein homolog [Acropora digitifera]|uniref:stimulated by retinoic acid gene 6 protein homolog n=1 Tax=Acropora digitifera TaxID=70779 RepID=UPI00077ACE5F|nr:PREDICTED: stimulated by retinoic acid gene 6 protein homolog [Acropora digitifera]